VLKIAWQPEDSCEVVQCGEEITILWPAKDEMGRLRGDEGKRVEKTFGVQAPLAKRRDVHGTIGYVSLDDC
jgi:hypothetical protein